MNAREQWKLALDGLDVVLGAWLFVSAVMLGAGLPMLTVGILVVLGLAAAADGMWALIKPEMRTPDWVGLILGLIVALLPWSLAFTVERTLAWNAWIIGALLIVVSAFALFAGRTLHAGRHQPAH